MQFLVSCNLALLAVLTCSISPFWGILGMAKAAQVPLRAKLDLGLPLRSYESAPGAELWDFDARPLGNSTNHLIFDTVGSLLQHWPNTRYRNGHTIIPATIAPGTLLYHGSSFHRIPDDPDWLATDPEHSYIFCENVNGSGCWHLTLITTRTLKLLYFDGSSAAKMLGGPMDSQDIVLWGKVVPGRTHDESGRIRELCRWAKEEGRDFDGFVRMEMDFEVMFCNFTSGVEIVSHLNLKRHHVMSRAPIPYPPSPPIPYLSSPRRMDSNPDEDIKPVHDLLLSAIESGSWHNHYPGEMRIRLDITRLISFYDTSLFPSLVALREGQKRWDHHLEGVSGRDVENLKSLLVEQQGKMETGSGVDWPVLVRAVRERYARRLEILQYILDTPDITGKTATKAFLHIETMVNPYILNDLQVESGPDKKHEWAGDVYRLCSTAFTGTIASTHVFSSKLTRGERTIMRAIEGVNREICRVVVGMWAEGMEDHVWSWGDEEAASSIDVDLQDGILIKWRNATRSLMEWLDWSEWVMCQPGCAIDELCYLPTWPFPNDFGWGIPQPTCVKRVYPFW